MAIVNGKSVVAVNGPWRPPWNETAMESGKSGQRIAAIGSGERSWIQCRSIAYQNRTASVADYISAHLNEWWGDLSLARIQYEEACRQNFNGNNEQRDLQYFLNKHGLSQRTGPLLP